jgi:hypothetical protein
LLLLLLLNAAAPESLAMQAPELLKTCGCYCWYQLA